MTSNLTLGLVAGVLVGCGVYLLMARGVVRALLGVVLVGNGINVLFLVASGPPGRAPIVGQGAAGESDMSDPLPQALVLTAIVISLAMTAYVVALSYRNSRLTAGDAIIDDVEDTRVRERAGENAGEEADEIDTIEAPAPDSVRSSDSTDESEQPVVAGSHSHRSTAGSVEYEGNEREAGVPPEEVR